MICECGWETMAEDLDYRLRRYTNIAVLIRMLTERQITLIDPSSWDDANDSRFMAVYKQKKRLQSLLALCFTYSPETYHHWHVFSSGSGGVCITLKKQELLAGFSNIPGVRHRKVKYELIKSLKSSQPRVRDLPFLKRAPYEPEKEFRIIYESADAQKSFLDVPIALSSIERVTLSPWLNQRLRKSVVDLLRRIPGCGKLSIARSTLIANEDWQEFGDRAV
jgi:hypothetical protein